MQTVSLGDSLRDFMQMKCQTLVSGTKKKIFHYVVCWFVSLTVQLACVIIISVNI